MLTSSFRLLLPVYILSAFSLVILASISTRLFWFQLSWVIIGSLIIFLLGYFNWRSLLRNRGLIFLGYVISLFLLLVTLFMPASRGVQAWIPIGPFFIQPVEALKITMLLMYAYFFAKRHDRLANPRNLLAPLIILIIPAVIILLQPDTGSLLVLVALWLSFLLESGLPARYLLYGTLAVIISSFFLWGHLADYQRERIIGVFRPELDPLGINYNVIQSKIAIGSAGFLGKGFKQGTQVQLGFLPESQTDFIIPSFIEEWGLLGGLAVLLSFFYLCREIINIGLNIAKDNFDKFICLGVIIIFSFHFFINIGSVTGLLPVIGLPFPFMSYGGSSLLTSFALVAIINSIASHA